MLLLFLILNTFILCNSALDKPEQFNRNKSLLWYIANHVYDEYRYSQLDNKSYFDCSNRTDDGNFEHPDCKKYWHCVYVGTLFESALERECPQGTMFHPILGFCEVSNWVRSRKIFLPNLSWIFLYLCFFFF